VTHASSPALYTDDRGSLLQHAKLDGVHDTPLQTTVNILLPRLRIEVGLLLGEVEGVYAAVQMRVLDMLARKNCRNAGISYS
jgi:hypothetical protein